MSVGVVVGGVLQLAIHLVAIYKMGLLKLLVGGVRHYTTKQQTITTQKQKFTRNFIPAVWGNSTAQVSAFLDTFLASFLATGSISYLYYANRIFQLPLALFAIATSVALFPRVARYLKNNDETQALANLKKALWFLLFLLSLSSVGGSLLAHEITALLFQRGAFDTQDTTYTAGVLQMYLLGLLPFGIQKLLVLWLYAKEMQTQAAKIATISLLTYSVFALSFISPLGVSGLALASTLGGVVSLFFTAKSFGFEKFKTLFSLRYFLALCGLNTLLVIVILLIKPYLTTLL
jgi:putative peptidoglycan lipid II flippase